MVWFAILVCATLYLMVGVLFAVAARGSIDIKPRWVSLPAIVLLWPLVLAGFLMFVVAWIARGSR